MMHSLAEILDELRVRRPRLAALGTALFVACTLSIVLTVRPSRLSAQVPSTRPVHVTVTDRLGRVVVGLERERFEVTENGILCPITDFAGADSPMILAIVSETALPEADAFVRPEDELIQTRSFPDALRQLSASKRPRKVILTTIASGTGVIPSGVEVLQTTPANLPNVVDQLGEVHQYALWVRSSSPSANVNIVVKQPPALPPLRLIWK